MTGGCGYIGSHVCISLLENNYDVLIVDSLINSYSKTFNNIKKIINLKGIDSKNRIYFKKGDIRDHDWCNNIFLDFKKIKKPINFVIHLAGLKSVKDSMRSPFEYWDTNISTTLSLIKTMRKNECFNMIFSSSALVYEPKNNLLLKEQDKTKPNTTYGKTKLAIEEILKDLFQNDNNDWRIANLRYFNPVGAHNSGLIGENPKGKASNLFPAIMRVIKGQEKKLIIYGNDWATADGTCIRDFVHVMDLADSHIAALNYLKDNKPMIIDINIGTGKGTSVLEVIKKFLKINKKDFLFEFTDKREGDEPYLVADNSLALKLLDWKPKKDLFEMCFDSIKKS